MTPAEFERISYNFALREEVEWHRWRTMFTLHVNLNRGKRPAKRVDDIIELPILDAMARAKKYDSAKAAKEFDFSDWPKFDRQ